MDYNILKQLLTTKKINIPTLAKEIGMSKPGLYIAIEKERLTIEILEKIAQALDVPVTIFFNLSRVDWVPVSEVDKLNNEITRLQNRLKEVEEQLEDKRLIIEFIKEKNLIPDSTLIKKGRKDKYRVEDFSNLEGGVGGTITLTPREEGSPPEKYKEDKEKFMIDWMKEESKGTKKD